jgi:hypothetical protein
MTTGYGQFKPPLGAQLNPGQPLARGLVGAWLLNEGGGTRAGDLSGNGNRLIAGATPAVWVPSPSGGALDFDTVSATSAHKSLRRVPDGATHITVIARLKWNTMANGPFVALNGQNRTGAGRMYYNSAGGGREAWQFTISGTVRASYGPGGLDAVGWYTTACVYDGVDVRIYRNGVLGTTTNWPGELGTSNDVLEVGRYFNTGGVWDGQIAYLLIYSRALTANEIAQLYYDPYAMFDPDSFDVSLMSGGDPAFLPGFDAGFRLGLFED